MILVYEVGRPQRCLTWALHNLRYIRSLVVISHYSHSETSQMYVHFILVSCEKHQPLSYIAPSVIRRLTYTQSRNYQTPTVQQLLLALLCTLGTKPDFSRNTILSGKCQLDTRGKPQQPTSNAFSYISFVGSCVCTNDFFLCHQRSISSPDYNL